MARSKNGNNDVQALNLEIAELRAKVSSLQKVIDDNKIEKQAEHKRKLSWRAFVIWISVGLATVLLVLGNMFFWAGNTIVDTNRYVAAVGPLIQKPPIQSAIADYTTTQLFNNFDVQSFVQSTLPPHASVLAPALSTQIKNYTQSTIKSLLANPKVQSYWYSSLTRRHEALINYSKTYEGNGTIQISDIYSQLSKRLADTKLSFLANKQLPSKVGSVKVATVGWLPALHKISKNIGLYQALATALLFAFVGLAVALSSKRRRLIIQIGTIFGVSMLLTLVATRIARGIVVSDVNSAYQSAVQVAYDTVLHSFVTQTFGILLISLLVIIVAWISGPYRSATMIKTRVNALLSGRLHQSIFGNHENVFTLWVGKFKHQLEWGSILLIALIMLVVQLSPSLVVIYGLAMLLSILVLELLAASVEPSG